MEQHKSEQDPFIFDMDQLHAVADAQTVRQGLVHFQNNSVTELFCQDGQLLGQVEDMSSGETMAAGLNYDEDGNLYVSCECTHEAAFCCHSIALLFAYADEKEGDESLKGAIETAIGERVKSGVAKSRSANKVANLVLACGAPALSTNQPTWPEIIRCIFGHSRSAPQIMLQRGARVSDELS